MSRMKDQHIDQINLEAYFIYFLEQLLSAEHYKIVENVQRARTSASVPVFRPDMVVEIPNQSGFLVIELKLYRSERTSRGLLHNAFDQLKRYITAMGAAGGILVVTAPLKERKRLSLILVYISSGA
jgi:hypothetical protein